MTKEETNYCCCSCETTVSRYCSVRLLPCGCLSCKDCLIESLFTAHKKNLELECLACGEEITSLDIQQTSMGTCQQPATESASNIEPAITIDHTQLNVEHEKRGESALQNDFLGEKTNNTSQRTWIEKIGQLKSFKFRFGNLLVPSRWSEDKKLASWVANQRCLHREGKLPSDRKYELDSLGFTWNPRASENEKAVLQTQKSYYDTTKRYDRYPTLNRMLEEWTEKLKQDSKLSLSRDDLISQANIYRDHLLKIESDFSISEAEKKRLQSFKASESWAFQWLKKRINPAKKVDILKDKDAEQGNSSNVKLNMIPNTKFMKTQQKHSTLNHQGNDGRSFDSDELMSDDSTSGVRKPTKKRKTAEECDEYRSKTAYYRPKRRPYQTHEHTWAERIAQLKAYKYCFGNLLVPLSWSKDKTLGSWVRNQRTLQKTGKLRSDRKEELDSLGFVWNEQLMGENGKTLWTTKKTFMDRLHALKLYKEKYGHVRVPSAYKDDGLGDWVKNVRLGRKKISAEQRQQLIELGLVFGKEKTLMPWEERLEQLKEYKDRFGNTLVPKSWSENKELSVWVNNQRAAYKRGKLNIAQKAALNSLGFIWVAKGREFRKQLSIINNEDSNN